MQDARTPLHLFLLSHPPNFPDVAVTRNKQLNEHLSAGDSFSPCEGLYRGCRREDSPLPWTACNDVKFTEAKKSLLFSLKQQEPTSAAPHLKYIYTLVMVSSCIRAVNSQLFLLMHGWGWISAQALHSVSREIPGSQ